MITSLDDLQTTVKLLTNSMMRQTLEELLKNDISFEKTRNELIDAQTKFDQLNLDDKQRDIIEKLIARKDELNFEYNANVYIAGILDSYELLKQFGITNE